MEQRQFVCVKCGCRNYEADQFQATGGNFAKLFDIQNKKYVYVVANDNTVSTREIQVHTQNDGKNFVVLSGLNAGERIVVEGVNQLKSGMKINPITVKQSEENRKKAEQALKEGKMPGQN